MSCAPAERWGQGSLQELDHPPLVAPVTKHADTIGTIEATPGQVDGALRLALTPHRGPVFLDVPFDVVFGSTSALLPQPADRMRLAPDAADLATVSRLLVEPGRPVVTEWAVYDGIQMAARQSHAEILTVASDPVQGIDVDELAALLARGARPAFVYVIPSGHNPLGASLSLEARQRLAELARRHQVPLVEDDVYGFLYYAGEAAPPLRALEEEWVFYLGSFSKILAPSLRAGWIVVPERLIARLSPLKHAIDLDTPSFSHRMIAAYLQAGHLPAHLATLRAEYRRRRDAMLAALRTHFPPEARWSSPESGMFVWVELPPELDAAELLRVAVETEQVAFSPGATFSRGDPRGRRGLRLTFTNHPPEQLEEAVRRIGRVIAGRMAQPARPALP